ncbi:MAG: translocation/assembly module TamB domain-containing protein, partial [Bacteroidia bacterium]
TVFLQSDIITVTLSGKFQLLELPHTATDMLSNYLPSYFPPENDKEAQRHVPQDFTWFVDFHNNTKPIQALVPKLEIAPRTFFNGKFNSEQNAFSANFSSPFIVYDNIQYKGIDISAESKNGSGQLTLNGKMDELRLTDTISTRNIRLNCIAANDSLQTHLEWDNKSDKKNNADINAVVLFEGKHAFKADFRDTQFNVNDSTWTVRSGNFVRLDSGRLSFHELVVESGGASIGLNGFVSDNPTDELKVSMKDFNIAYLNYFTVPLGITLKGYISSESGISDVYETPIFTSNSTFKDFWINGQKLGDGELDASWLKSKQAVYINGYFSRGIVEVETGLPINNVALDGFYYPKNKENSIDIEAKFISIPLETLQPFLKNFCSVMVGQIDGNLHITGTPAKIALDGKMDLIMKKVRVDYLGLALRSNSQPVKIENNSFFFDDYKVMDENGNVAKIYGHLYHDNFTKFQFDMDFGFDHFMVLNTTANMNEAFYGRVFASGYMNVFGYVDDIIHLNMNVKTEKIYKGGQPVLSEFSIPMSSGSSEVSANDFIYFETPLKPSGQIVSKKTGNSGLDIIMEIEATEDAIVKVIFDKTVGDELTAYGSGNLTLKVPPSGDMSIRGQYQVTKGKYLFTMKNIVLVPFELANGGVISWNGDPSDAQINADAVYKTTTSVEPFFPTDSTNPAYHRSYPVDVVMHLTNNLMNPYVSFDINLPTADQNIQETVRSYTQTDLERNRQVLSLMVLNSFMTPSELRDGTAGTNYAGDVGSTLLSNFVSGTLNNWLSQISSDFNMGVKYRANDDLTTPDLKVFLSTQLLNNRITIDGNVGKVNATQATSATGNNSQWVGDVNVEYKVTDDGKVRLRAFNRSNDNVLLTNSSAYTQGVGVFYKEEFDTWEQFFRSKRKKKAEAEQDKVNKPAAAQNAPAADSTVVQ